MGHGWLTYALMGRVCDQSVTKPSRSVDIRSSGEEWMLPGAAGTTRCDFSLARSPKGDNDQLSRRTSGHGDSVLPKSPHGGPSPLPLAAAAFPGPYSAVDEGEEGSNTVNLPDNITDAGAKLMNATHRIVLRLSGGRVLNSAFGMPAIELHTIGRKTGRRRATMLTAPLIEDDRVVLVASKGGDDRHPDWYRNLVANPEVELTIEGTTRPMRARTATPEEKAELWPRIVGAYKGYGGYQKRTDRDIPVVICEPPGG